MAGRREWWIVGLLAAALIAPGRSPAVVCTGDCNGDGSVRIEELVSGVALALGQMPSEACDSFADQPVRIESLVRATANALSSCGPEGPYIGPPASLAFADLVRNAAKRLDGVRGVAVSPDGRQVYVASNAGIAIFARDAGSGRLTLVGEVGDAGAGAVAISPDGRHLYAITFALVDGLDVWQVVAFSRDPASGSLTPRQALPGSPLLEHLVVSADGTAVYVAAAEEQYAPDAPALRVFRRDTDDGELTETAALGWSDLGLTWVRTLAVDDAHLYAGGSAPREDRSDGRLVELRRQPDGHLTVERHYEQSALGISWVGALARAGDSLYLSGRELVDPMRSREVLLQLRRPEASAPLAVAARLPADDNLAPTHLAVSASGDLLAVGGAGTLGLYAIGDGGALAPHGLLAHAGGIAASGAVAFGPDGADLYAATHVADGVTLYTSQPALTRVETWRGTLGGIDGIVGVRNLAQSAGAATVYASGDEHTLAVFARDADSGALDPLQVLRSREEGVQYLDGINEGSVAVSADDANVYATIRFGETVVSFTRDAGGTLLPLGELADIARDGDAAEEFPYGLAVSPDGAAVYASGASDVDGRDFVAVLARDPATGALRWDGGVRDGGGVLACSADGLTLYGVADSLAGWSRATDGQLASLRLDVGPTGDVLALSPDGRHVYLAARQRPTISVFARAADGRLTFLGDDDSGLRGVDGLAVRPDGLAVYAVSSAESSLSVLARRADGRLAWRERHHDGSGADGLSGAAAVLASSDGRSVYVAGAGESAIAIFRVVGEPLLHNGAPCEEDETCASAICDFSLAAFGDGGPAGPIFSRVCCERVCDLDQACDDAGVCQTRPVDSP